MTLCPYNLDGPYRNYTARARRRRQVRVFLLILLVALLVLFFRYSLRAIERHAHAQVRAEWSSWLSYEESRRLMKYHGVDYLRISEDTAEIERGGRWVPVKRKGE
jgi:hypothetical protein